MKINKRIIILIITIMITFAACTSTDTNIEENAKTPENIKMPENIKNENVETKYHKISVNSNITDDLNILDMDLEDKQIIFTAEYHGIKSNKELEIKFLKYVKEQTNFKYLLLEMPYSQALKINEFLDTGDTAILDELFKYSKGTSAYAKENYDMWLSIYKYNSSLDENNKIMAIGVDVEHQVSNAVRIMRELIPSSEASKEIEDTINILKNYSDIVNIKSSHEDLLNRAELFKEYFKEKYFNIEMIVRNIKNLYYVREDMNLFDERRDKIMYENFMDIYETIEDGIFYGQWGHNHTYQSEENGLKWFAAYLNEEKFKDKILTIAYAYNNCKYMGKTEDGGYMTENFDYFSADIPVAGDRETAILFDIRDKASKYHEYSKYYQYMLVISDSEATTPLNE